MNQTVSMQSQRVTPVSLTLLPPLLLSLSGLRQRKSDVNDIIAHVIYPLLSGAAVNHTSGHSGPPLL